MKKIYLKFPDENTALQIMALVPEAYYIDDSGKINLKKNSELGTIDVIGKIYSTPEYLIGEISEDGLSVNILEISPAIELDGWHVNILINNDNYVFPEILNQYIINAPKNPTRTFG